MNSSFEKCNICNSSNMIQIYIENSKSLTTMNELIDGKTAAVFYCEISLIYIQNH